MGLDMYLNRYPKGMSNKEIDETHRRLWKEGYEAYEKWVDNHIVAYWRKVNFLHGYIVKTFAKGVDDCNEIEIDLNGIKNILEKCEDSCRVLDGALLVPYRMTDISTWVHLCEPEFEKADGEMCITIIFDGKKILGDFYEDFYYKVEESKNKELDSILPPYSGPFFGSCEYDYWYVYDVFSLRDELKRIIDEWDESQRYVYRASW